MLAQLARRRLDAISTEVYEAQFKLKAVPSSTTLELGTYLTSLDDIKDMVTLVFLGFLTFFPPLSLLGVTGRVWEPVPAIYGQRQGTPSSSYGSLLWFGALLKGASAVL